MKIAVFGGTGGLGTQVVEKLRDSYTAIDYEVFEVISLGSKDVRIEDFKACEYFFKDNIIDVVINLSGINFDKFIHKVTEIDSLDILDMLDINLGGSINIAATALPGMRSRGYGRLIFTSSILATTDVLGTSIYGSCKAFIDRLVKGISAENISKGITANSIQLGYFDGGLTHRLTNPETYKEKIPLKRWGTIDELVNTIEYLIKTEYVTGQNIRVGGGI